MNSSDHPSPPNEVYSEAPMQGPPREAQNANAAQIAKFVTPLKNMEQQVGEHIINALQHADTVAVLTSVVLGADGQQHIVSAALDPSKMAQINALLASAEQIREEETLCVGFHCLIKPKPEVASDTNAASDTNNAAQPPREPETDSRTDAAKDI